MYIVGEIENRERELKGDNVRRASSIVHCSMGALGHLARPVHGVASAVGTTCSFAGAKIGGRGVWRMYVCSLFA